jgi:molecular chaperone DnaK
MSYQVGVDLGTTYSAAAVCRPGGPVELVPLGQRAHSVPSTVYIGPDAAFLVGEAAERRALSDPGRVVREFKRRIGDPTPVLVGREPVAAEELAARFLSRVLRDVAAREGAVAERVAVTHPAGWGPHKLDSLRGALGAHGLGSAVLLSEPQAAAVGYADAERVEPGATVAVYDLGGGTFDAAVVRKTAAGGFELLGTPEGIDQLGGVDFDEAVFAHVRAALGADWAALDASDPEVLAAVAGLRRECTAAKEALSHDTEVLVPVLLPGVCTQVRLGRSEFEEMIRPAVAETVAALRRALESAGVTAADLSTLLLVGGSSRIPLVTQAVAEEFGRSAAVDVDPKGVIAAGAAVVARAAVRGGAGSRGDGPVGGTVPRGAAGLAPAAAGPAPLSPANRGTGPAPDVAAAASRSPAGPDPGPVTPASPRRETARPVPAGGFVPTALSGGSVSAGPSASRPGAEPSSPVAAGAPMRPAPRPPKQARPFTAAVDKPENPRRVRIAVVAGAVVLALLGGAAAFGATRIGANREADASTPPTSVTAVSPVATAGVPTEPAPSSAAVESPAPPAPPRNRPPARRTAAPPPATTPPPAADPPGSGAPVPDPAAGTGNGNAEGGAGQPEDQNGAGQNGADQQGVDQTGADQNGDGQDGADQGGAGQDENEQDKAGQNGAGQRGAGQGNTAEDGAAPAIGAAVAPGDSAGNAVPVAGSEQPSDPKSDAAGPAT